MKKLVILALVAILLPTVAQAQTNPGIKQGDPGFYMGDYGFPGGLIELVEGESWCLNGIVAVNYYYLGGTCNLSTGGAIDTFAVITSDLQGWTITHAAEGICYEINDTCSTSPGCDAWYIWDDGICITVPCDGSATPGMLNTLSATMVYCDETWTAQPDSGDCDDPNINSTGEHYSTMTQDFEVVEPAPALVIFQDTLYLIEEGLAAAYVPFSICNGDLCAGTGDYDYVITSKGHVGAAINQTGTATAIEPGNCEDIFAQIDAGAATACTYDTLTIIGWDVSTGLVYDTCVLPIHVVEPVPVPLFTAPVVTILVLAMILAAAVIMKRHAVSKV
jgi:hypothetical protein